MRLELEWGGGVSINVEVPGRVTAEDFLETVRELEALIKRDGSWRDEELVDEMKRLNAQPKPDVTARPFIQAASSIAEALPTKPQEPAKDQQAFEEFMEFQRWKQERAPKPLTLDDRLERLEKRTEDLISALDRAIQ